MKEWEQKVINEKEELVEKTTKLDEFINSNFAFDDLYLRDKALLRTQLDIMKAYIAILDARIVSHDIEVK